LYTSKEKANSKRSKKMTECIMTNTLLHLIRFEVVAAHDKPLILFHFIVLP
jgi:hypothetical protein